MKKSKKKLSIEKFRITKLTNTFRIIGGSEDPNGGDDGGTQTEDKITNSSAKCLLTDNDTK